MREALRALAAVNNGKPLPARCARDARSGRGRRRPDACGLGAERPALTAVAPGVAGALGRLLATVATAMADGSWARMKSCAQPNCGWIFFDRSNNRSSRWCTMADLRQPGEDVRPPPPARRPAPGVGGRPRLASVVMH